MKWLNYHHLFYFRTIAQENSIVNASKKLRVGQPALSSQLKQLEENLGAKLFERKNKKLILTEAGQVALKYANEIFKTGEEFVQIFNDKAFGQKKHYNIGATDMMPKLIICNLIERAKELGDNCSVTILEESLSVLMGKLMTHELDLVFTNADMSLSYDVKSKKIGISKIGVFGSKKFASLKKSFPKSLDNQPVILPTKHSKLRYEIDRYYKDNSMRYDLVTECQDSAVKKLLAVNGKGIVFLPLSLENHLLGSYDLVEIGVINELSETFWLSYPKSILSNSITDSLLKSFKI